jgi:hypothetical protein
MGEVWRTLKGFRHLERAFGRYSTTLTRDLEKQIEGLAASYEIGAGRAQVGLFKTREIARDIGEEITRNARIAIYGKSDPALSQTRVDIRTAGGTASRPEPNVWGVDKPLVSSRQLYDSLTYGIKHTLDGVEVQVGIPNDSPAADYAPLQELGGISAGMIPGYNVPPRPFLVPGLVASIPFIESACMGWIAATWAASVKFGTLGV